ncbi:MAG TPA: hypothetical protein VGQ73_03155, partial [Gemmatimonadales bacterium]|nr:hypothetical protein [Gemmatimonadales bacterium]
MRTTRSVLLLALAPAALGAQVAMPGTPPIRAPDLVWLAPVLAEAQARTAVAMAQAGPALARARAGMLQAQAALAGMSAHARAGLQRAQAALAANAGRVAASAWSFDDQVLEASPPQPWAQQDPADRLYRDARAALNRENYSNAAQLFG